LHKLHTSPFTGSNIYAQLVYQAKSSDVTLTMVDGRIVFEGDRLFTIDEHDVLEKSNRIIKQVYNRAGIN
jgi:5-methylthioadenosine/S-adenosylhomocysteine deaminase